MMKQRLHKCSGSGRSVPAPSLLHVWSLQCETMLGGEPSTSEFTIVHTVVVSCKLYGRKGSIIRLTKGKSKNVPPLEGGLNLFQEEVPFLFRDYSGSGSGSSTLKLDQNNSCIWKWYFLIQLYAFEGICSWATRPWGEMGQKRILLYKIGISPHWYLGTFYIAKCLLLGQNMS